MATNAHLSAPKRLIAQSTTSCTWNFALYAPFFVILSGFSPLLWPSTMLLHARNVRLFRRRLERRRADHQRERRAEHVHPQRRQRQRAVQFRQFHRDRRRPLSFFLTSRGVLSGKSRSGFTTTLASCCSRSPLRPRARSLPALAVVSNVRQSKPSNWRTCGTTAPACGGSPTLGD
jgi:hypothetical protein